MPVTTEQIPLEDLVDNIGAVSDSAGNIVTTVNGAITNKTPQEIIEYVDETNVFYEIPYQTTQTQFMSVGIDAETTVPKMLPPADSNAMTIYNNKYSPIVEYNPSTSTFAAKVANGQKFFFGSVVPAIYAASVGISLGKAIDSTLYNLNPDFWDANGMSSLNPATWASITNGDDSLGAKLFNFVFGIDDNGNTQGYVSQDAYVYLAQWLNSQGFFATAEKTYVPPSGVTLRYQSQGYYSLPISFSTSTILRTVNSHTTYEYVPDDGVGFICYRFSDSYKYRIIVCTPNSTTGFTRNEYYDGSLSNTRRYTGNTYTYIPSVGQSKSVYYNYVADGNDTFWNSVYNKPYYLNNTNTSIIDMDAELAYIFKYGTSSGGTAIEGITDQDGATVANPSTWTDPATTLQSLQTQYPQMFQNAVPITTLQPDGTTTTTQYLPVPVPNALSSTDTQPTTSTSTQTTPQIDTATATAIQTLVSSLIAPTTTTTPDTGSGSSPTPTPVTGASSALWAIYHPSQGQVDSFGAWLWSSSLIDQIKALMFSPIDCVISLHKVYCTPTDAGTSTIQVGYLDSEVPSAYITEQYVYVDCGSVNLYEKYGNVFDYAPNTDVHIYLPFIGIVPLDVGSVMRSTINVKYGVDILTGDCLAMVKVTRDGQSSIQYQYSGNCAVQYPLTAGNYMGLVTGGISAVAMGIGAAASGGALAGVVAGGMSMLNSKTNVSRSGGFSGNAGALGGKIPYLIIERPQTKIADYFPHYQGYPTNAYVKVGDCSGYIRASELHTDGVIATDKEIDMIVDSFRQGVIV